MNSTPDYCQMLVECNPSLRELTDFCLYPGMEFQSPLKWWPDSGFRPTLHEGIDFCYYRTSSGDEEKFSPEIVVPVMTFGKIMAICPDYLGHTIFFDHLHETDRRYLSIYAHLIPQQGLKVGQFLREGELVGHVADTTGRRNRMPTHLHLSILQIDSQLSAEMLSWALICNSDRGQLIDPLTVIDDRKITFHKHNHWKEQALQGLG